MLVWIIWCIVDAGWGVLLRAVCIRCMLILLLVWRVCWRLVGVCSGCVSILDIVRISQGSGLSSLLSLGGIGSTVGQVPLMLGIYSWRLAGRCSCERKISLTQRAFKGHRVLSGYAALYWRGGSLAKGN
jgi:hypothetical protein